ncbi:MAG TPA: LysR family transcriptional regulator [Woeseiaceae bacterium]|nr:LysR family transcriptional regulator [Woeseiaceae bacterium]
MQHLDLAALRSLVAISETRSVTQAAAMTFLTQSAVSMQVKRLEQQTRTKLLERVGRGVLLTDDGEKLASYARQMLALNDEALIRLVNDQFDSELTLGVPFDIVNPHIPIILREARNRYPHTRVKLVSSLTCFLKERFAAGTIDIAITTEATVDRRAEELVRADLHWWGACGGHAHRQSPLPVAICNNCAVKPEVTRVLGKAGIPWEFVSDTDTEAAVHAMVSADLAVTPAIGARSISKCEKVPAGLLPELPRFRINLYVENARNPVVAQNIAEIVRDVYRRGMQEPSAEPVSPICA